MGEERKRKDPKVNASRDAFRSFARWNVGWRVPLDTYQFKCEDGSFLDISYLDPRNLLRYLLQRHPSLLLGGVDFGSGRSAVPTLLARISDMAPHA